VIRAVRGDQGRVRQILINLIGNAIKFTEAGEVVVRATREPGRDSEVRVRFSVTDTGIGIPADQMSRLFQEFSQIDGPMKRQMQGTGLGLTISKRLAEMMRGRVGVESEPGRGSTFWFTASLKPAIGAGVQRHAPPFEIREAGVLVVEGNPTGREFLTRRLQSWGARATGVGTGAAALAALRDAAAQGRGYRIVLVDSQLLDMDAETLAQQIRQESGLGAVALGLLVPLGNTTPEANDSVGAFAHRLTKPVREAYLVQCLAHLLRSGQAGAVTPSPSVVVEPDINAVSCRALLVEDNRVNQLVAKGLLEKNGMRVGVAGNGREALRALDREAYDIVFMDLQMPEMDGYEATVEIRQREGAERHLPIVAMTAHAMPEDRARCFAVGMDDYLTKPVAIDDLRAVLRRWRGHGTSRMSVEPGQVVGAVPPEMLDIFDKQQALTHAGGDPALLLDLIRIFQGENDKLLAEIRSGLLAGDPAAVERGAHRMKGSLGTLAARTAREAASRLETLGRAGELTHAASALGALEQALSNLDVHLAAIATSES